MRDAEGLGEKRAEKANLRIVLDAFDTVVLRRALRLAMERLLQCENWTAKLQHGKALRVIITDFRKYILACGQFYFRLRFILAATKFPQKRIL